jgi:hypothetical protein
MPHTTRVFWVTANRKEQAMQFLEDWVRPKGPFSHTYCNLATYGRDSAYQGEKLGQITTKRTGWLCCPVKQSDRWR